MIKISITITKKKAATFTTTSFQLSIMSAKRIGSHAVCQYTSSEKFETCVDNKANLNL